MEKAQDFFSLNIAIGKLPSDVLSPFLGPIQSIF